MRLRPPRATRTYTICTYTTLLRSASNSEQAGQWFPLAQPVRAKPIWHFAESWSYQGEDQHVGRRDRHGGTEADRSNRSDEHTSELQSLMRHSYAIFCLTNNNIKSHNQFTTHHQSYSINRSIH